ncbi:MAG: hypothetical protein FWH14_05410 [Oscillospiraceae bacterium]|nr:hypothetical protein [Oscillospiraceae bacterium]
MANTRNKVAIVFDGVVCCKGAAAAAGVFLVGMTALGHPWLFCGGCFSP